MSVRPTILLTGGAGFIGSHTLLELLSLHYVVHIADNFCNSSSESLIRVAALLNKPASFILDNLHQINVCDRFQMNELFEKVKFDCVIHFAALKAVGESVSKPLEYYDNNITSALVLLETMKKFNCKNVIFSSSATVYGDPEKVKDDLTRN